MKLRRLPLESADPVVRFADTRLAMTVAVGLGVLLLGFPYEGRLFAVIAGLALPWAVALGVLARRRPAVALSPLVAAGEFAVLAGIEAVVPETYGGVRFLAIFFIAAHSHFQGEQLGLAVGVAGVALLAGIGVVREGPVSGDLLLLYESLFAASALATAAVVGRLRTAESAGRLRARGLTRRAVESEDDIRRRLANVIHDGPVQELTSLELMLQAMAHAAREGDVARVRELLVEAQEVASRNVRTLRDEIVALGPQAYDEVSFASAVERLVPFWRRRFGIVVQLDCEQVDLPPELEGDLLRIAQEAVANAGKHAQASTVTVTLRRADGRVELLVRDDGRGFRRDSSLLRIDPGHLGLASMRERAEAHGGRLRVSSGPEGTEVRVRVPLAGAVEPPGGD